MKVKNAEIHLMALRFVSQCFSANDASTLIDIALAKDVLTNYQILLCSSNVQVVKETLWGISNITASSQSHVNEFFAAQTLTERVLTFTSHQLMQLRGESLWVICNAITTAHENQLLIVFQKYGTLLLEPLCEALSSGHDIDLVISILRALSTLLSLDHKFGGQLIESESVMAYFDSLQAFSKIEELLN